MPRVPLAVAAAAITLAGCVATPAPPASTTTRDADVATTSAGPVRGRVEGPARVFRGVPYAADPVGDLRWRAPRPVTPWTAPRDATAPAALCAQNGLELGRPSSREDCLSVDVTTPARTGPPRPVLVWLHGGSFVDGGGGLYGAARLADRGDLVVVTVNYRLGALGFLAHPALPESGSLGLADQQAALRWVHREITAFGGDPGNVTLAGESGGGAAVCAHLSSPATAGLVHRAIVQSSDCTARRAGESAAPRPRDDAEPDGLAVAAAMSCPGVSPATAACLRGAPVDVIRAASRDGEGSGPSWGTAALPADPVAALRAGRTHPVPVLLGVNRDEERFRLYGEELASGRPTTLADLRRELGHVATVPRDALRRSYPCDTDACAATTLAALRTDVRYVRGLVSAARVLAPRAPTWVYEFADPVAPWFRNLPAARFPTGAYHTSELPFLFDVDWSEPLTPAQRALADDMVERWAAFARTGDPNVAGGPPWRRYATPSDVQLLAPGPGGVGPAPRFAADHHLELWSPAG